MYMSYCKFEGTRSELRSCLSAVNEHIEGYAECAVSDREIRCFKETVIEFIDWLHDVALLDDEGYLDEEALDQICEDMKRTAEDEEEDDDE